MAWKCSVALGETLSAFIYCWLSVSAEFPIVYFGLIIQCLLSRRALLWLAFFLLSNFSFPKVHVAQLSGEFSWATPPLPLGAIRDVRNRGKKLVLICGGFLFHIER